MWQHPNNIHNNFHKISNRIKNYSDCKISKNTSCSKEILWLGRTCHISSQHLFWCQFFCQVSSILLHHLIILDFIFTSPSGFFFFVFLILPLFGCGVVRVYGVFILVEFGGGGGVFVKYILVVASLLALSLKTTEHP